MNYLENSTILNNRTFAYYYKRKLRECGRVKELKELRQQNILILAKSFGIFSVFSLLYSYGTSASPSKKVKNGFLFLGLGLISGLYHCDQNCFDHYVNLRCSLIMETDDLF